jgi:cell division protein FtsA
MPQTKIIAALDVGTTKVIALVAEVTPGQTLALLGKGEVTSLGMRKGEILDFRHACDAAHAALHLAEKTSGVAIEGVYLGISGGHIDGFAHMGTTAITSPNALVDEDDIARAIENAKAKTLPPDRLYIHHIKNGFLLDGKPVTDPLHMQGQRLEASYWHIHGDAKKTSELINLTNRYGLTVDELILNAIASASVVTSEDDRVKGCLVLDIGGGTTDYCLYRQGVIIRAGAIPIGGDHLSNDLALGLRINISHAETLKKNYGKALVEEADKTEQRWLHGDLLEGNSAIGNRPVKLAAFAQILQPRLEELFDIVRDELGEYYDPVMMKAGVVLTGGTARLPGIVELAKRRLAVDARLATPLAWVRHPNLRGPEYTAAAGLLYSALTLPVQPSRRESKENFLQKITKLFSA